MTVYSYFDYIWPGFPSESTLQKTLQKPSSWESHLERVVDSVAEEPLRSHTPELDLRVAFLQQAPLFRGLTPAQCYEAARRARDRRFTRKQLLFREGEPADDGSLLGTGRVKITQLAAGGQEVIQRLVGPGEVIGGVGLPPGGGYPVTAEALEVSHALFWDRPNLDRLFDRYPLLYRNALRIVAERLRNLEERFRELATEKVPQRLGCTLLRLVGQIGRPSEGGVLVSLSREELAQMTGTTLFTVSRLLCQWESQGVVRTRREAIVVDHTSKLIAIARGAESLP